jgi:hypothetical protein
LFQKENHVIVEIRFDIDEYIRSKKTKLLLKPGPGLREKAISAGPEEL